MTGADFYFICFLVGFALSAISALAGTFDLHLPYLHHDGFHFASAHAGIGGAHPSPINFGTAAAFLAWFGGIGFLLVKFSSVGLWMAFSLACVGGFAGSLIIFWFFIKVLAASERPLDAADYEMVGVFGRVTSRIHAGRTGEMIFSQEGVRRSAAARSEDGADIPKGADVLVTRYDKGIAYVRRWQDLTDSKEDL